MMDKNLSISAKDKLTCDLHEKLFAIYRNKGCLELYKAIKQIINECKLPKYDLNYRNIIKGTCVEVYLQARSKDFVAKLKNGIAISNLCFPRKGTKYTTEIDNILILPTRIYLFECKCYRGGKVFSGKGELKSQFGCINVYNQSKMHADFLLSWIQDFLICNKSGFVQSPIQLVAVDGDFDGTRDIRSDEAKAVMPLITLDDLDYFFSSISTTGAKQWDLDGLYPVMKELYTKSDYWLQKHLEYHMKGD